MSRQKSSDRERSAATSPRVTVVFFYQPGCPDCRRVRPIVEGVAHSFPNAVLLRFNIDKPTSKRRNEALCERFHVPDRDRLTVPMLFTAAGVLTRKDLRDVSPDVLQRLIIEGAEAEARDPDWYQPPPETLQHAGTTIRARADRLTFVVVVANGLLDGVNPCAFAVVVLLISWLQLSRRRSRDVLLAGGAFASAVFIAYFLMGLGFAQIVARIQGRETAAMLVRRGAAVIAAVFAVLSVRDGIRCLKGRLEDMTLQLSAGLKARIRTVIRKAMSSPRVVAAAFVTGFVVSILELACTGQVYLPTILFALRQGPRRTTAAAWLLLYNTAFILPLIVVTLLAYSGVQSLRFSQWLRNHSPAVKFLTAGLFAVIACVLFFS